MTLNSESKYPSRGTDVLKVRSDAKPDALVGRLESMVHRPAARIRIRPGIFGAVIVDGQFRWKDEDGRTGVFTLHEGGGKRVLTSDGGGTVGSAKWERAW